MYSGTWMSKQNAVKRIADLGANVGMSVVYWAHRYPAAQIDAYKPHPVHLATLEAHIKMNRMGASVVIHPVAVGTSPGTAWLTDEQASSRIDHSSVTAFTVRVVDFFETVAVCSVDLLKMDIEGAEYAILMDKLSKLDIGSIAFEWHNYPPAPGCGGTETRSRQWIAFQ
jgi:FkbM family methyltransferase